VDDSGPEVDRWEQGLNYRLEDCTVGVMNVFEIDGSALAQLSVWRPDISSDETVRLREGDDFSAGLHTYRVVAIVLAQPGGRAFVDVTRVRRRRWRVGGRR
jgi:hypothetical protein